MIGRTSGQTALQHAIDAAELYMKAVKEAATPAERARLKRKCQELVARAEQLKNTTTAAATTSTPAPGLPARGAPQQSRELSTAEKTIVLRSSRLYGSVFPPWESAPPASAFTLAAVGEPLFT